MKSNGIIGKGLSLVKAFILQKLEGGGSFKGVKMTSSIFNFKSPLRSFSEEYGIPLRHLTGKKNKTKEQEETWFALFSSASDEHENVKKQVDDIQIKVKSCDDVLFW